MLSQIQMWLRWSQVIAERLESLKRWDRIDSGVGMQPVVEADREGIVSMTISGKAQDRAATNIAVPGQCRRPNEYRIIEIDLQAITSISVRILHKCVQRVRAFKGK